MPMNFYVIVKNIQTHLYMEVGYFCKKKTQKNKKRQKIKSSKLNSQ